MNAQRMSRSAGALWAWVPVSPKPQVRPFRDDQKTMVVPARNRRSVEG
jgi:hypothetical protein